MSILDQIVDRTRSELTRKKTSIRVADLKGRPLYDHDRISLPGPSKAVNLRLSAN